MDGKLSNSNPRPDVLKCKYLSREDFMHDQSSLNDRLSDSSIRHLMVFMHLSFPQVGRITGSGRSGRKSFFKLAMPLHSLSFTSKVRVSSIAKPSLQGSCSIKNV